MKNIITLCVALLLAGALPAAASEDPYYGEIMLFASSFVPEGWIPCDGRLLSIAENSTLYALLGTMYGGDGIRNFAVPDLRGRTPVMPSPMVAGMNRVGQSGGSNKLAYQAFRPKDVTVCVTTGSDTAVTRIAVPSNVNATINNRSPCLAMVYCIAAQGYWPQRD